MRILLTGRNGQVGWALTHALQDVVATDRQSLDLALSAQIVRVVREVKPDVILNAAAYTAVDKAESEPALATQVNALAPGVLAEEARRAGALLVHYSTDYVFDGAKAAPYTEDDAPNPLGHYARTKLEGERAVAASGCRHLILRTSWVYGPRAANFYQLIARKAALDEPMRMVDDQTSVPTPAGFLAQQTVSLLQTDFSGILNLVPCGEATRFEFAVEVSRRMGSASRIERASSAEFPSAARRPAYSVLDNRRAAALLGRALPGWRELVP